MAKLPYMQFYPGDWLLDTQVISAATRGIWIDILSLMWREEPRTGTLEYTASVWCKRLRCTDAELRTAVLEMETENICKILKDECNDSVRFTSRRISRDEKARKNNMLYVRSYRSKNACKNNVRGVKGACKEDNQNHISEVRSQKSEEEKKEEKKDKREVSAVQVSAKPSPPLTDESWILSLESNSAYKDLHVKIELEKCKTWCETNRKTFSRRRFVNWLNRIDRPIQINGHGAICQERVQRGSFLKPCGAPSVAVVKCRPLCQTHKEQYDQRTQASHTTA